MDQTEKRICWYSSLLIGLLLSSPKFLALRENGIMAHYWHFNPPELAFQVICNIAFCFLLFINNLNSQKRISIYRERKKYIFYFLVNAFFTLLFCGVTGIIQRSGFINNQLPGIYWLGYITRYLLSGVLAGIVIKIILLLRQSKQKEKENSQLKTAYLEAELELLKEQLNPHFLFNSLSSLSGIVKEDPGKAQHYINHLSKIFRYALAQSDNHLVSVADELAMIKSYEQLLKMRFEDAFQLETAVDTRYLQIKIPHLTLQPLLENAAKHNSLTLKRPLKVKIFIEDDKLIVSNNLQEIAEPENSTGIGLANLNSRFRILINEEIEIVKSNKDFIVKLPLIK